MVGRTVSIVIIGCIEVGICSTKDTTRSIVGVKDVDDPVAISIVVGNIAIVGNKASRWTGFDRVGDQVVIAVQIAEVFHTIAIAIDWNGAYRSRIGNVCVICIKDILQAIAICIAAAFGK